MLPCSSCAVPKEEYQESIRQQLELELEFSALDQEIHQHGLAPALGEAAAGPGRARAQLAIWDTTNKDLEWTQSSLVRATDISSGDTYLVSREVVRKFYNRPVVRVSNYFSIFD